MTILTLKKDFITLFILLFLNETIHSQFKNEMIPAFYVWVIPDKKNAKHIDVTNNELIPSFHCQYVWFLISVINHYIYFYAIGDTFINYTVLYVIGIYVIINKMSNGNTFIQGVLGMFLGICYGMITTKYILHLEPVH